jgi:hypothetical protein
MTGAGGGRAVLDACVLYPEVLRGLLIGAAAAGAFDPVWSPRLFEEWRRTAWRRGGPAAQAEAEVAMATLRARFPEAEVSHAPEPPELWLPDAADIHVLATAIAAGAARIVTLNLRDFPKRELAAQGIEAVHPDALLYDLWLDRPNVIDALAAEAHRRAEARAGQTLSLRALLKRARLPRLAKAVTSG